MSELVTDCPRCHAKSITFDVIGDHQVRTRIGWQRIYEAFSICRRCKKSTVFVLGQNRPEFEGILTMQSVKGLTGMTVNEAMRIEGFVSLKDVAGAVPPEHVPEAITSVFNEAATCLAVNCFNAAGTMFRLCVDLATRGMLPEGEIEGLNNRTRRDLGLRLKWLLDNNKLPEALRDLSACIREDGNDGAHAGTLTKEDAEDLLDFSVALLERLFTEPERLRLAQLRRADRRNSQRGDRETGP